MMFRQIVKLSSIALSTVLCSSGLLTADTMTAPRMGMQTAPSAKTDAPVDMKKVSEAFGHFIGRHLKSPGVNFDLDAVIKGIRDGAEGKPAPMTDKEYEQMMLQVQKSAFDKVSQENIKAADEYIQKNTKAPGIIEVKPNRLYYQILKPGSGESVKPHGSPQINYTGKFIDGTTFGSSEDSGGPVTIPLDQTIPGFSLGLAGMKEGEKRRLWVHPELGYGTTGHLPPNSLLIFDIEVVKADSPNKDLDDDDEDDDEISPLTLDDDNSHKGKDDNRPNPSNNNKR